MTCHALTWRVGNDDEEASRTASDRPNPRGTGRPAGPCRPISWGGLHHEHRIHRLDL
jgi:hypothetical protein